VEGAGLVVLRSGIRTLKRHHPIIWLSIHDINLRPTTRLLPPEEGCHDLLRGLGYTGTHLATDHEEHWVYV